MINKTYFYIHIFTIILVGASALLVKLGVDDYRAQEAISNLKEHYDQISYVRDTIIHEDAALTMSARMAAATGDVKWEALFNKDEVQLATTIHQAIKISPAIYRDDMDRSNANTVKLLGMERKAFVLIREGKTKEAMDILFGKQYGLQKDAYIGAIERLNALLKEQMRSALVVAKSKQNFGQILFITVLCLLLLSWLIIRRMTRQIQEDLMESNRQLLERTRQLEKLYDIQKDFTSTLSHELRTPLAAIKAAIDIVISGIAGEITDQQKDFLGRGKSNVDRLNRLINDMLDLTHLESGRDILKKKSCDINNIIQSVIEAQVSVANARGLYLKASLQDPLPQFFLDEDKIIQVMGNFINNAIKFTASGGITVSSSLDTKKNQIEVRVQDTGSGIAKEDQEKIFEKFQQLGDPHQRQAGTGLGLAICKGIIRQHGGRVGVESTIGQGSCFYFILPVDGLNK